MQVKNHALIASAGQKTYDWFTMIKAVIFDMDGVITDSERSRFEQLKPLLAAKGIKIKQSHYKKMVGVRTIVFLKENFGKILPQDDLDEIYNQRLSAFWADPKKFIHALPFAQAAVKKLAANFKLAIASSAGEKEIRLVLTHLGIIKNFSQIIGAQSIKRPKPAPDVYLAALQKLKLSPQSCIAVEDSPVGVRAAKAAGLICIGVTSTSPKKDLQKAGADLVIKSLQQLTPKIIGLLRK